MSSENERRPLYFWHIPKTAGSTITAWLDCHAADSEIFRPQLLPDFLAAHAAGALTGIRLMRGHYADAPIALLPVRPLTFTVLREPLARTMSHLAHVDRDPSHPLHERVRHYDGDVDGVLRDRVLCRMLMDFQARYLAVPHRPPVPPEDDAYRVVNADHPLASQMGFEFAPLPPRRTLVRDAWRSLAGIDIVGTTRGLYAVQLRVAKKQNWPLPQELPQMNKRPEGQHHYRPEGLTRRQRVAVRRLTPVDTLLYARVRMAERALRRCLPQVCSSSVRRAAS